MTEFDAQPRALRYRVVESHAPAPEIRVFRLRPETPEDRLSFLAGQYVRLSAADAPERPFSIASRPDEEELEIHIRLAPGGSSETISQSLRLGERVSIRGPYGVAHLRDDAPGPLLAIAGGSGMAPMKSIVDTALQRGFSRPAHLYFGVRHRREIYCLDHFGELMRRHPNLTFTPVVMDAADSGPYRRGLVTDAVEEDFGGINADCAYLAGPPPMIAAARRLLAARGIGEDRIFCDDDIGAAPEGGG